MLWAIVGRLEVGPDHPRRSALLVKDLLVSDFAAADVLAEPALRE